jgi:diketogulonate reductase-like aldo/keto reductase
MTDYFKTNRRKFLAQSAALAATATLPVAAVAQESMRTRPIPGTGEMLPVVGLGAPTIFSTLPPEGKALPKSVIQAMVDAGGTFIDTPAFFRPDVPVIGELLSEMKLQQELFLAGKITVSGKQEAIRHLERTEQSLNKRPMDLLLIHNMRDMQNNWPILKDWKAAGRVRYIGVSLTRNADYVDLERFMKTERPDFIMTGYSIFHPLAAESALPLATDLGIAVVVAEPFKATEDGAIFNIVAGKALPPWAAEFDCKTWAQFSLKYILANPAITCVVTETSKVSHAADNMRAGYGRLPDEAMRRRMSEHLLSL